MKKCDVFISWSGNYAREIAETLKIALDQLSMPEPQHGSALHTFVSSQDIEVGTKWRDELDSALSAASQGIILVTQDTVDSEWLAHEAGALGTRNQPLRVFLVDAPPTMLPDPLLQYQFAPLDNERLAALVRHLAQWKGAVAPSPRLLNSLYEQIADIRRENAWRSVTDDDSRWRGRLERPLMIAAQNRSPYDLEQVFGLVRRRLVLVAQNHRFMTDPKAVDSGDALFWPLARELLVKGASIDVVGMHPDAEPARVLEMAVDGIPADPINVWAHYMRTQDFVTHTTDYWNVLREWAARYTELRKEHPGCGQLRLFSAYFTPVSIMAVDPETENGVLVVSPRMGHEANASRPQFILKRSACPVDYDYYWGTLSNGFQNGGWKLLYSE